MIILPALVMLMSCGRDKDTLPPAEPVSIVRVDSIMSHYASADSVGRSTMLDQNRTVLDAYLQVLGLPAANDSAMLEVARSPMVSIFAPAVDSIYTGLDIEQQQLGNILARGKQQGLDFDIEHFAAVVWGRPQSIMFNDKTMMLALNHYLGENHDAYKGIPAYVRAMKTRASIPYDMTEALIGGKYPIADNTTVLANLLYQGALAEAKMQLLDSPCEAMALGFTDEQLADIASHEKFIWERLVRNDMIHSTDRSVIGLLFDPAPVSALISPDSPGRTARYVGYRIVKAYLQSHPDTKLADLFSPTFYNSTTVLADSGYAPQGQ